MRLYETVFIVAASKPIEEANAVFEKFKGNIEQNGGKLVYSEAWGKIRMAYEIEGEREGYYFLVQFEADVKYPKELETRLKYDESVLRYIVIKIDGKKFKLKKREDFKKVYSRREERERAREDKTVTETVAEEAASEEAPQETPQETIVVQDTEE